MERYRTVIIEDEKPARDRLKFLLGEQGKDIEIIGEADNGEDGHLLINELRPDLVFLDIEMPLYNGFEMLSRTEHFPLIIFVTAFEGFAVRAFEENSIDYLLKPVQPERLARALEKLKKIGRSPARDQLQEQFAKLIGILDRPGKVDALAVSSGNSIRLLRLEDILYLEAEEKYVFACDVRGKRHLLNQSLTGLKEQLGENFVQIRRSCIINSNHIVEMRKGYKGKLCFIMAGTPEKLTTLYSGTTYSSGLRKYFGL